jgi:hypothetical protein
MPVGVQIIAGPFREDNALRVAAELETGIFATASNSNPLMRVHRDIWLVQRERWRLR